MLDQLSKLQTILIVDDSKSNIILLSELLRSDFRIKAANTGEKALEIALSNDPPDLILLEVVMPGLSGYEVCKQLKSSVRTRDIPVIFITGRGEEADEVYGLRLGAVDYITKPFSPILVRARVETHAELKRHHDFLESISYIDGLTRIPNRRKFNEFLELAWNLAEREVQPISMIMIDIDDFKRYNDHYGHQEGDNCMIMIANALTEAMSRKTDIVARYGGEEFVCVLPNVNTEGALIVAEKLREAVYDLGIPHAYSKMADRVTISLGVATMTPDKGLGFSRLIIKADAALYKSKELGKNRASTEL